MKTFQTNTLFALALALLGSACSHRVMDTYPKYLSNNVGTLRLPSINQTVTYSLTPNMQRHKVKVRSMAAGAANSWYLEFGKALEATLTSDDVRRAAPGLIRSAVPGQALHLEFDVLNYDFRDHHAFVSVNVRVFHASQPLGSKVYTSEGNSQGGKMFWGGAMAMQNAIHQSTKAAIDTIMFELFTDINATIGGTPAG